MMIADRPLLPRRQREVLVFVADGRTDLEIAAALGIAPRSVGNLLYKLYRRLGARNRAHAAAIAVRLGLVREPLLDDHLAGLAAARRFLQALGGEL